jgi:signal transduction histidine kinase
LNNIAKHAKAGLVKINLKHEDASIELSIRDDGKGFDPEQPAASGHYGLSMMREHAEAVGVQFFITSQPGRGTELTLRWVKTEKKEAP